jgi:pimeloyl-ACP methyl ester carboxylesterase
MIGTARFLRQYLFRSTGQILVEETVYRRAGRELGASFYRLARSRTPRPAWIVLHGLTHAGRRHAALDRFVRAVAASGSAVFVPEVPEWQALSVRPEITLGTIAASLDTLNRRPEIIPDRIGVIGFSFGATQALVAASEPATHGRLAGIAAWGGYCEPRRLFHFGITGEHELDGIAYRRDPDPYGRWIMGGNYLTRIPGYEGFGDCARALHQLALESGRAGRFSWEPYYDPLKERIGAQLPTDQRELFRIFAPPSGSPPPDGSFAADLARRLADAAVATDPLLDPRPHLQRVGCRVLLAHGRDDRLVPFTESLRLQRQLDPERCGGSTITSLFAHSGGTAPQLGPLGMAREAARFATLLHRILDLV